MDNAKIAQVLEEMAELLEFRGENPFRIRAYQNGARAIRDLDEPVAAILEDPQRDLASLPGIGETLEEKCRTLVETGSLPQLEKLRREVPQVLVEVSRVPGVGPKKASRLVEELGLGSLEDLRLACQQGRVGKLKGFGAKTEASILDGLTIAEQASERVYWCDGHTLAESIGRHMARCETIRKMSWAGSYRRGKETVGDLDLVAVAADRQAAMDHFEKFPERTQTIGRGETKLSMRVGDAFQVDLRLVAPEEFGAALQYFTGSKAHNVHLRRIAKRLGLKVNEYGVFREPGGSRVAGETEEDVYQALGLPWIPPELREDRQEFEWAQGPGLPSLLQLEEIRGDLHMHTSATDGTATVREMAEAAIARGLEYIAITDHSRRVTMAGGLDPKRLRDQWRTIDELRPEFEGRLRILKGIECDILEKGGMDLPDDCLAEADWVLASVHYGQRQSREEITDRILGAIENAHVDCIAHPTGRLINRRPPYDVDLETIFAAAKKRGKFLELNANPARLDLDDVHLAAARRHGIPIVINTDAHSTHGLDVMSEGVRQARRAGLSAEAVANTRSADELLTLCRRDSSWAESEC